MKRKHVIAIGILTAIAAGGATILLLERRKRNRRKAFVANAGYETAYDVQYPIRYSRNRRKASKH